MFTYSHYIIGLVVGAQL